MPSESWKSHSGSRTSLESETNPRKAVHGSDVRKLPAGQLSPFRLLVTIIGGVFMAEVVAMVVVYYWGPGSYLRLTLVDAGIMTVLIFPLLYLLSFRPLVKYIEKNRQAEETLLRSLNLQERFFDSIDTLIAYMDRDFNFIRVNEAFAKADGKRPEEFIGRNHFELYPHVENQGIFQRVVETGEAYSVYEKPFEYPGQPERGITYWNWSLLPVRGVGERIEGLVLSQVDVTERVRAEELNRQLSRIVEQTGDTVVVTDCDGVIEYVNPTFEKTTGYTLEEVLGKTPRVLKSGLQDEHFYKVLWDTILGGKIFQGELANRKKNGELFYEVKTITPLRNDQGDITQFVATGKDITAQKQAQKELQIAYDKLELRVHARTEELRIANSELEEEIIERKRAEEAIKESEEKYRSLFSNMSEGFGLHEIILDTDGNPVDYRFLEINAAFEELTGLSREKILGKTILEVLPETEAYWIETYGKVTLSGEPVHFVNYSAALGRWYEIYCYSPRKHRFAVLFFDVTDRVRVEEALRESENRYRILVENAPVGIYEIDLANRKFISVNDVLCNGTGYSREELLSMDALDLLEDEHKALFIERIQRMVSGQLAPGSIEYKVRTKSGSLLWVLLNVNFTYNAGIPVVARVTATDVTERKQAEAQVAYLASFPEQNPNPIMEVDFDGQLRYANPAARRLFPDLSERGWAHAWLADWEASVRQLRENQSECLVRELTVGDRFYQQSLYPFVADGLVRIYGADITERKQAEVEIQQAAGEVRAANEELKRFNTLMVGRELRMIQLKKEVNELCARADQPLRYPLEFEKEGR